MQKSIRLTTEDRLFLTIVRDAHQLMQVEAIDRQIGTTVSVSSKNNSLRIILERQVADERSDEFVRLLIRRKRDHTKSLSSEVAIGFF